MTPVDASAAAILGCDGERDVVEAEAVQLAREEHAAPAGFRECLQVAARKCAVAVVALRIRADDLVDQLADVGADALVVGPLRRNVRVRHTLAPLLDVERTIVHENGRHKRS
jgi:hypothetical protein